MRLPEQSERVTLYQRDVRQTFPPPGFLCIAEGELGNGDGYGLYWPVGREQDEPLVVLTLHDNLSLLPAFSSLESWLRAEPDEDDWIEPPDLDTDPGSPSAQREAARERLRVQDFDGARALLESAVALLPEYTDALIPLWSEYRRLGRTDDAIATALQALRAATSFGPLPDRPLNWLAKLDQAPGALAEDPLWQRRRELKLEFGGIKRNPAYPIFDEAVESYARRGSFVEAVTLLQSYGALMATETVSFQDRYDFTLDAHARRLDELLAAGGLPARRSPG